MTETNGEPHLDEQTPQKLNKIISEIASPRSALKQEKLYQLVQQGWGWIGLTTLHRKAWSHERNLGLAGFYNEGPHNTFSHGACTVRTEKELPSPMQG